jgi:hypothetical protein
VQARLRAVPGVTVVPRDEKLKNRHAQSRIWNETWLAAFFHKPCNHELFVLQSLNMEGGSAGILSQNVPGITFAVPHASCLNWPALAGRQLVHGICGPC